MDTEDYEGEAERREAALAATPLFQPNFKSSKVTQAQLEKFRELHKRRMQIKERSKNIAKHKGNASTNTKACEKHLDKKESEDKYTTVTLEDSNLSTAKGNTSLDETPPTLVAKNRQKLHWGMSQRSTQGPRPTKYVTWTQDMDRVAMDTFVQEYHKGNKADNGWKSQAFQAVINAMDSVLATKLTKENIRSRIKTWKRTYTAIAELLNVSGFGWNDITKMVDASDVTWADYLKSHPTAASYRNRSIPDYDILALIIGNDQATGTCAMPKIEAEAADERVIELEHGDELDDLDPTFDFSNDVDDTPTNSPTPQAQPSSSRIEQPKKKKRHDSGDESSTEIIATMKLLAEAIRATFEKVDVKLVMTEVMKIEGFDQRLILESIEYLSLDSKKANMFLALPEELRKAWLLMRLRDN